MQKVVALHLNIDVSDLAMELSDKLSHEELINLIMEIDSEVRDLYFTKALQKKLKKVIKVESL